MGLEGRIALVTGAGGEGMGRSIALTLARDGADVVLNFHRKDESVREPAAVTDAADAARMVAAAVEAVGHVDILVNSAGGPWKPQDVTEIDPAHLRRVL